MNFYPEKKKHISPSGFASWFTQRAGFIRSYFEGLRSADTEAMKAGTMIHQLIEGNFLQVKHKYEYAERTLCFALFEADEILTQQLDVREDGSYDLPGSALAAIYGVPDSFGLVGLDAAVFVDYKSGKENTWDDVKLAGDLKMKFTALLVWLATGKPHTVKGFIEYLPTVWNPVTRKVELIDGEESTVAGEVNYTRKELEAFLPVIVATIHEINEAYPVWESSSDEFVNMDDVAQVAELRRKRDAIEAQLVVLMERISDQMEMGRKETLSTPVGTFFFTNRKKYAYPPNLEVTLPDGAMVLLGKIEPAYAEIEASIDAAKKKFETENKPESVGRTLSFKPNTK